MIKQLIERTEPKSLENDGVRITGARLNVIFREFYDELRKYYTLKGTVRNPMVFSVPFQYESGSYFPSVEPDGMVMINDVRFSIYQISELKFFFTSSYWIDISITFDDGSSLMLTFSPNIDDHEKIAKYLDLKERV